MDEWVTKEEGFRSLVALQAAPISEAVVVHILIGFGVWFFTEGIRFTLKQKDKWNRLRDLQQAVFLEELDISRSACLVGRRFGKRVSEFDKFAASRTFGSPLVIRALGKLQRVLHKEPMLVSSEMSPVYVGGWRPIREVEPLLRGARYIFGIEEGERRWIPSSDELEAIRRDYSRPVSWIVCDTERRGKNRWHRPEYRPDGTMRSDLLIVTKSSNPLNPQLLALALSGTHREGTLAAGKITSELQFLEELAREKLVSKNCLHEARHQMLVRCYFEPYSPGDKPGEIKLVNIKVLGATSL